MKKIMHVLSLGIFLMLVLAATSLVVSSEENQDQLDQHADNVSQTGFWLKAGYKCAQSFTPSLSCLSKIEIHLAKKGNPSNLYCSIRDSLDGSDLTSAVIRSDSISGTPSWYEVDLPDLQVLTENKYYIVISAGPDYNLQNTFNFRFHDGPDYTGGERWNYGEYGNIWHEYPGYDICFRTYGYNNINNQPPKTPSNPNPSDGATNVGINVVLSWTGGDPDDEDTVTYDMYLGSTNPPPKIASNLAGTTYIPALSSLTKYYWKIVAFDNHGAITEGPIWQFTVGSQSNNQPDKPTLSGPISAVVGQEYIYSAVTTDPDDDEILYWFNWGDGTNSGWIGPYNSGVTATRSKTWSEPGSYTINVKAKDTNDAESTWSDSLEISVEKSDKNISISFNIINMDGLECNIQNIGGINLNDVEYNLSINGGLLGRINAYIESSVNVLNADETINVSLDTDSIGFGIGSVEVILTVSANQKVYSEERSGFILGRLIIIFGG